MNACACGHSFEEHGGGDPLFPGATSCNGEYDGAPCDCVCFEEDADAD